MRATRAIIHLDILRNNLKAIRSVIGNRKMCVSVKADAYGHGAVECAKTAVECGADFLAVACVSEGEELRRAGIDKPILLLSLCIGEEMDSLIQNRLTPLVFSEPYIRELEKAAERNGVRLCVHLAVDTGMGRIGCLSTEAAQIAERIVHSAHLTLGGMCTHFAAADSTSEEDRAYTNQQIAAFNDAVNAVRRAGIDPGIVHSSSSGALLDKEEARFDMVRPGIIAYGYYPGDITEAYLLQKGTSVHLEPVMSLETRIVAIRHFSAGMSISYGHTWTAEKDTDIGVLPIGYADGLFRRFAKDGDFTVAVNGKAYPVRGRICMDQCMIDLGTNSGVRLYDTAVIFGGTASGALQSAQDIADKTGTISYEITSAITKRVPRVFI